MSRPASLGIDLGTQSTKALVSTIDGEHLTDAAVNVDVKRPRPGWAEQDPTVLFDSAVGAVRAAVERLPEDVEIVSACLTGQMGGLLAVGADGNPVTAYESWMDTRAADQQTELLDLAGDQILDFGGIGPLAGAHLRRWCAVDPGLVATIATAVPPVGYVTGRFCRHNPHELICDRTQANLMGCYDAQAGEWIPDLVELLGIGIDRLPRLAGSTEVVGHLAPDVARACGLNAGIPVAAGLGDGTAGWLAGGGIAPGRLVSTAGTSEHLAVTVDRFISDPERVLSTMPSVVPGLWHLIGFTNGTGLTRRHVVEVHDADFDRLEEAATLLPPGSDGVICVPHMHGQLTPFRPLVRGTFLGFTERTTAAHYYRAVLEALSFEMSDWTHRVARLVSGFAPDRLTTIGGGARSRVWGQVQADVLGIPVSRASHAVNAARGASLIAAVAVGAASLQDPGWHQAGSEAGRHEPGAGAHSAYAPVARRYASVIEALQPVYAALAANDQAGTPPTTRLQEKR